jgi:hypothetical protein
MTKYQSKIVDAQRKIAAKGQIVTYMPVRPQATPNASSMPWKVGASADPIAVGLNNLTNVFMSPTPDYSLLQTVVDTNPAPASVQVSMVFLDAKARGSSTQGMVAEFVNRTDIIGGNKLGLLAGGLGVTPVIGDRIDRGNGYPIYSVSKLKTIDIDGTPIMYTLELEL